MLRFTGSQRVGHDRATELNNSESVGHSVMSTHFVTPWTVARQAPLSMEFSRQEYGVG